MAVKSSFKNMVLCLGLITLGCAFLLSGVYILTEISIKNAEKKKMMETISAVLPSFDKISDAVNLEDGSYYMASKNSGDTVGFAVTVSSTGFGGKIRIMVGFRPDGIIYDTSVLEHSETPGLGAKCTEVEFASQFKQFDPAVKLLKVKKDGGDVDAITASTITSRAYCAALENAVKIFKEANK